MIFASSAPCIRGSILSISLQVACWGTFGTTEVSPEESALERKRRFASFGAVDTRPGTTTTP